MKPAYLKAKNIYKIFFALFLFISLSTLVSYYSLAYYSTFYVDKDIVNFSLKSLEATSTDFQITGGEESAFVGVSPYKIYTTNPCEGYDESTGDCAKQRPNLCPYISIVPKGGEAEDVAYKIIPEEYSWVGEGKLNFSEGDEGLPLDLRDDWTVSVKPLCFEGECPADYDRETNGDPIPQNLKGQIFRCDLTIESTEFPPMVMTKPKIAYAAISNTMTILANISGGQPVAGNSNVVFIPGLQSSRLYNEGLLLENQLWEPNRNADVEWLYLDENGKSLYDVYTRDIIERTNVGMNVLDVNIYKSFADEMDSLVGEKKINEWKALPYDWRMDLNKVVLEPVKLVNGETYNFIDEIIKLAESSRTKKVSIVTHSNGGLVAKVLINELKKLGKENLVDNLVMVAAPELGTPTAIASLLHGDEQELAGGFLVNKSTARTLGENMMGAYNLLPSEEYFKKVSSPVVEFDASVSGVKNFKNIYGENIDNIVELKKFLSGFDGRVEPKNSDTNTPNVLDANMLSLAGNNHNVIDNLVIPENIKVTELAGWGISTIRGVKYFGKEDCISNLTTCVKTTILDRRPLYTTDGDETVVSPSATLGEDTYYLDMKKFKQKYGKELAHKNILEAQSSVDFVTNILLNSTSSLPEYISKEKPISSDKTLELALHSPVSIDVYDALGNHTGLIKNQNPNSDFQAFEENILGSRYVEFGEGKYVLLDDAKAYTVKLQGLDVGTFTLEASTLSSSGAPLASAQFVDIPTSPDMKGEITISATGTASTGLLIKLDVNGDGKNDFTINPAKDFDPIVYLQILKKTVETFNASEKTKKEIYKKVDAIIKSLEKNKTKNAILKIKQFSKDFAIKERYEREKIESRDQKENSDNKRGEKKQQKNDNKKKELGSEDAEKILQMLNQLLNNLTK
jgi:hypothetical protein